MIRLLAVVIGIWLSVSVAHAADLPPFKIDLLSWARASPVDIGCQMEKLGHRDSKFNCDLKDYTSARNPCENTTAYYEGPIFPKEMANRVHPFATEIHLSFEHGALQSLSVQLDGAFNEQQVLQALGRPPSLVGQGGNIMSFYVQPPAANTLSSRTTLGFMAFDHQGAGDVDCSGRNNNVKSKSP